MLSSLSIVFPAYNESKRIVQCLKTARAWASATAREHEIILVVEKSTDDTLAIARKEAASWPELKIIACEEHRGKGAAVKRGFLAASKDFCLMSDVDWSVPADFIETFCVRMEQEDADICFASRRHPQSRILIRQPCYRRFVGSLFNVALTVLGLTDSSDTQCGFKLFRRRTVQPVFEALEDEGFAFDAELLLRAKYAKLKMIEMPVDWSNDENTTVKIRIVFFVMTAALKRLRKLRKSLELKTVS